MKVRWLAIAPLLVPVLCEAYTFFYRGQQLHDFWLAYQRVKAAGVVNADPADAISYTRLETYVAGIADRSEVISSCLHDQTIDQLVAIVGKALDNHPERWNAPAAAIVEESIAVALHCKTTLHD